MLHTKSDLKGDLEITNRIVSSRCSKCFAYGTLSQLGLHCGQEEIFESFQWLTNQSHLRFCLFSHLSHFLGLVLNGGYKSSLNLEKRLNLSDMDWLT